MQIDTDASAVQVMLDTDATAADRFEARKFLMGFKGSTWTPQMLNDLDVQRESQGLRKISRRASYAGQSVKVVMKNGAAYQGTLLGWGSSSLRIQTDKWNEVSSFAVFGVYAN